VEEVLQEKEQSNTGENGQRDADAAFAIDLWNQV
jgi:hypothetical protein